MKILVDADACPVKGIIEKVAIELGIPLIMIIDTNHILESDYSQVITVGQGPDAVDLALINRTCAKDIVVTGDYGVATLVIAKKAYAINQNGRLYTDENIEQLLFERHISKKQRKAGKRSGYIKKRTKEDDEDFEKNFRLLCEKTVKSEES